MMVNKGFKVQDIRKDIEFKVKKESFNRRCMTHKWEQGENAQAEDGNEVRLCYSNGTRQGAK